MTTFRNFLQQLTVEEAQFYIKDPNVPFRSRAAAINFFRSQLKDKGPLHVNYPKAKPKEDSLPKRYRAFTRSYNSSANNYTTVNVVEPLDRLTSGGKKRPSRKQKTSWITVPRTVHIKGKRRRPDGSGHNDNQGTG